MGQILFRHAGTVVPDADGHLILFPNHGGFDHLVAAAMLGRVVQQIGKDLAQPLRVPGDEGKLLLTGGVGHADVLCPVQLLVGEYGVLKFRRDVHRLHVESEAAVLDPGELQQLIHHLGQTVPLADDDG